MGAHRQILRFTPLRSLSGKLAVSSIHSIIYYRYCSTQKSSDVSHVVRLQGATNSHVLQECLTIHLSPSRINLFLAHPMLTIQQSSSQWLHEPRNSASKSASIDCTRSLMRSEKLMKSDCWSSISANTMNFTVPHALRARSPVLAAGPAHSSGPRTNRITLAIGMESGTATRSATTDFTARSSPTWLHTLTTPRRFASLAGSVRPTGCANGPRTLSEAYADEEWKSCEKAKRPVGLNVNWTFGKAGSKGAREVQAWESPRGSAYHG
jgi:hypothetical protein